MRRPPRGGVRRAVLRRLARGSGGFALTARSTARSRVGAAAREWCGRRHQYWRTHGADRCREPRARGDRQGGARRPHARVGARAGGVRHHRQLCLTRHDRYGAQCASASVAAHHVTQTTLLGRRGHPDEIASAVVWLAGPAHGSPRARPCTSTAALIWALNAGALRRRRPDCAPQTDLREREQRAASARSCAHFIYESYGGLPDGRESLAENYPAGIPAEIDADRYGSIPDLFDKTVARFSDKPAYQNLGHTLSYADLDRLSRDFAAFLQGLPGMARASALPSCRRTFCSTRGAVRCPAGRPDGGQRQSLYTPRELEHQLRDSGPSDRHPGELRAYAGASGREHVGGACDQHSGRRPAAGAEALDRQLCRQDVKHLVPACASNAHHLRTALARGSAARWHRSHWRTTTSRF